jgi:DNA-binding NtrC family response regulator
MVPALTAAVLDRLMLHRWPGNVRELRNVVEHAAVLAEGERIEATDLRLDGAEPSGELQARNAGTFADAKKQAVEDFERAFLLRALREHDGNVSRTAEAVGMLRQSLQQKLRELGIRAADIADEGGP